MRIAYCTNVRLPNERAHGHQIAKVVQALTELGHSVEIFCPYRMNPIQESFVRYYDVSSDIQVHQVGSVDGIAAWWAPGILGLKLTTFLFGKQLKKILAQRTKDFDCLYTRTPELLPVLTATKKPVIVELHRLPRFWLKRFARHLRRCRLVVALTTAMRTAVLDMGISNVPVIAEGDAVDPRDFASLPEATQTRITLGVPDGVPLIGYAGQLESMGLSKGIPELLEGLLLLKKRGVDFRAAIAGGPAAAKERFVRELDPALAENVTFLGFLPHAKIPTLMSACDVLVYPAPASTHPFYLRDTSPLKIFEYMAAGQPIVSADLPPIRDVLTEQMAFFCRPGDAESLADALRLALTDRDEAAKRAKIARGHSDNLTWKKRMERIMRATGMDERVAGSA